MIGLLSWTCRLRCGGKVFIFILVNSFDVVLIFCCWLFVAAAFRLKTSFVVIKKKSRIFFLVYDYSHTYYYYVSIFVIFLYSFFLFHRN